tara:strand:+ start:998 stop:1384 length:387 start_codon:yes stop_codon:yes gene_type:complete
MKITFLTSLTLLAVFTTVKAHSSFSRGLLVGGLTSMKKASRMKESIDNRRYVYQIIDTELLVFCPKNKYQCVEIRHFIPLTSSEKMLSCIGLICCIILIISMMKNMDNRDRDFFIGFLIARALSRRRR